MADRDSIRIGLRIRNDSDRHLAIDRAGSSLEVATGDTGDPIEIPAMVSGPIRIAPGAMERLEFEFLLPAGLDVRDLTLLDFDWSVDTPLGLYTRSTPFERPRPVCYYDPAYFDYSTPRPVGHGGRRP